LKKRKLKKGKGETKNALRDIWKRPLSLGERDEGNEKIWLPVDYFSDTRVTFCQPVQVRKKGKEAFQPKINQRGGKWGGNPGRSEEILKVFAESEKPRLRKLRTRLTNDKSRGGKIKVQGHASYQRGGEGKKGGVRG